MRRRELVSLIGGAAAWPVAAGAQQRLPIVGYLTTASNAVSAHRIATFEKALAESGFVNGQTIEVDHRLANDAAALVARAPKLIATAGNFAALKAQAATKTIPIVFTLGGDPALKLVASLNHPGGNITGFSTLSTQSETKRLQLLSEIAPDAKSIAVLINPRSATTEPKIQELNAAAKILNRQLQFFRASNESETDAAFAAVVERRVGPILITADNFYATQGSRHAELAARQGIPAISPLIATLRHRADLSPMDRLRRNRSHVRGLRRANSQRREARRPSGGAIQQARTRRQPQGCQGTRSFHAHEPARPRRRGNRVRRGGRLVN